MIKINSEKYASLGYDPIMDMVLSGWEWKRKNFLGIYFIIYEKKLLK